MDKAEAINLANRYAKLVKNYLGIRKAVLFGSYAEDRFDLWSDIDVGLFIDKWDTEDSYLTVMSKLYELTEQIDIRIEPHLFVSGEDESGFAAVIEKDGLLIEVI
ncbi:MAG: nucleotidyltransferase domain-containing protein [Deltaproteobacteria bacterium]|nr:nucleotidyltransferase domain-containing protein [Deltaproteobacteria bacterium]